VTRTGLVLLFPALLLLSCHRTGIQNEAAVRQGVVDYLAARSDLNMSQMQVDVNSVAFRQDEADVTVSFRPKGGSGAAAGMQMSYVLQRQGNRWVVKGKGTGPHQTMTPPGGMPPHGGAAASPGGQMPPGHPQVGSQAPPETKK
jgi:hypothetical protein